MPGTGDTTTPPPALLRGRWFDGIHSRARPVLLHLEPSAQGPQLVVHPLAAADGIDPTAGVQRYTASQLIWPEAWNPRRPPSRLLINLRSAGSIEISDAPQWQAAFDAAGGRHSVAQRMQSRWSHLLAGVVLAGAALLLFYRYGTPWLAGVLTAQVPLSWEQSITARVMEQLDGELLQPSKLPAERQQALQQQFSAMQAQWPRQLLHYPDYRPPITLLFRSGLPANAFALPGGTVVVTDALVQLAARRKLPDDAILGVLSHEAGHVLQRHGTRMVIEQGVLNTGLGLALGDVSWVVNYGSTLLTGLAYQRSHETEADCFAIRHLQAAGRPTQPMGELLLALAAPGHGGKPEDSKPPPPEARAPAWTSWLSSHPDTQQRAQALAQGHAQACVVEKPGRAEP
ncbi:MAG: M48 family metallopeptidase [Comamonas sp.]